MKAYTKRCLELLESKNLDKTLQNLSTSHGSSVVGDTTVEESIKKYFGLKQLMVDSIQNGEFDTFSYHRRQAIINVLTGLSNNLSRINSVVSQIESLQDNLEMTGIFLNKLSGENFEDDLIKLKSGKKEYQNLIKIKADSLKVLQEIQANNKTSKTTLTKISSDEEQVEKTLDNVKLWSQSIDNSRKQVEDVVVSIKTLEKEAEDSKIALDSFKSTVDEYKSQVDSIVKRATEVIAKDETINKLIKQARESLKLSSTVGISTAFSAQYDQASDNKKFRNWLGGAGLFFLVAIGVIVWSLLGTGISSPDSWGAISARIVAVGISIAGATFCSQQYVKQKNIAEDYAYKATLAKSIVAFSEEIAISNNNGEEYVGDYLRTVLAEIHKDPLRERSFKQPNKSELSLEQIKSIKEIIERR